VAKKKKKKKKIKISFFGDKNKKRKKNSEHIALISVFKVTALILVIAGVGIGFYMLDKTIIFNKHAEIYFVNPPKWATEQLKSKIKLSAAALGEDLAIDDDLTENVYRNLKTHIPWLDNVKLQIVGEKLLIGAHWRKPLAMLKTTNSKIYVDKDLVVLDFIAMPELGIPEVTGISNRNAPLPGQVYTAQDLQAAVTILEKLDLMDQKITPSKPLLHEIGRIDVSNFNGRKKSSYAHIILYTTSGIEIIWGAEFGAWQRHMEAPDEEKLANLYGYYKQFGTLLQGAKYINLRDPQHRIYKPVDNY